MSLLCLWNWNVVGGFDVASYKTPGVLLLLFVFNLIINLKFNELCFIRQSMSFIEFVDVLFELIDC